MKIGSVAWHSTPWTCRRPPKTPLLSPLAPKTGISASGFSNPRPKQQASRQVSMMLWLPLRPLWEILRKAKKGERGYRIGLMSLLFAPTTGGLFLFEATASSGKAHRLILIGAGFSMKQFTITFDALLVGHENHVTAVSWRHIPKSGSGSSSTPTLLSSSTDASLILWSPTDSPTSIWVNRQRFGDVIGAKAGGFVGALWNSTGGEVLGWGWNGCWRRWRCTNDEAGKETWAEVPAITGHNEPVKGLAWDPNGDYIITSRCVLDFKSPTSG